MTVKRESSQKLEVEPGEGCWRWKLGKDGHRHILEIPKRALENNITKSGRSLSFQCCFWLVHFKILEIWFRKRPFQKSALSLSKAASHFALSCVLNSPHTPVEMLQHYQLANNEGRPFESSHYRGH